ncbi:hypothetical protein BGZ65_011221, partial [Modicella reniformis]
WLATEGSCHGYARQFPLEANVPFGDLDGENDSHTTRHYEQDGNFIPCSDGSNHRSDETRQSPISKAYLEGDSKWGPMAKATAGDIMCVRWPSKTHGKEDGVLPVYINMPDTPLNKDPNQKGFTAAGITPNGLPFGNCSTIKGGDSDHTPCGGCFTVPKQLKTGNYVIQWRWLLTNG